MSGISCDGALHARGIGQTGQKMRRRSALRDAQGEDRAGAAFARAGHRVLKFSRQRLVETLEPVNGLARGGHSVACHH